MNSIKKHWDLLSIEMKFVAFILLGGFVFIAFPLMIHGLTNCPEKQPITWQIQGNEYSNHDEKIPYWLPNNFLNQQQKTYDLHARSNENFNGGTKSVLCEDFKVTDLLIVFFTYCLVVVGWFALRRAEETIKIQERGYLFVDCFAGGLEKMILHNHGKTPVYADRVEYRIERFPGEPWTMPDTLETPNRFVLRQTIPANSPTGAFNIYANVGNEITSVYCGKAFYRDVFGINWTAAWAVRIEVDAAQNRMTASPLKGHGLIRQEDWENSA